MTTTNQFTVSDEETAAVIADFLEMGHLDNIIAMFRQDPSLYDLAGEIINDERFMVRMGMVVLFETMVAERPAEVRRALPVLAPLLAAELPASVRGETATILGLIGSEEAISLLMPLQNDRDPQIAELARDILEELS